ncbi:MAG: hypothetical protein ACI943_001952, partial [Gammaproteobacteria bacterium]
MEQTYCLSKRTASFTRTGIIAFSSLFFLSVSVQSAAQRITDALVSLYTFHEGAGSTVHDMSGFQAAEDLTIEDVSRVSWLAGGGLSVDGNTIIKTSSPAFKQFNALSPSLEMSFEFWVTQEEDNQTGPARIMTMSANTNERNYTIGQENYDYIARLRTSNAGGDDNGAPDSDSDINIDEDLQHFVYTIDGSGNESWYLNGVLVETDSRSGDFTNWNNGYYFALANEMTMDRPWFGDFHLVAVYCQELDQNEVLQNYNEGPNQNYETCETIINGSSPYAESDPVFLEVIANDSYCCSDWWDNTCQEAYNVIDIDPVLLETCSIDGYDAIGGRILYIPEFGTDFKGTTSGLFLDKFSNGTAHMYGSLKRISDSNDKFDVDLWFDNGSTYAEWIVQGMDAKNPNLGDESTWTFYLFDDSYDNTLTGKGDLSGVVLYLDDTPDEFGLQIGNGANSLNSNDNGLSTWFTYTGTNNGTGDFNATYSCDVVVPECDEVVLDQWSQENSCEICEDSFTSTINDNYGGSTGDVISFEDPICNPGYCVTAVTVTFNVAAADYDLSQDAGSVDQLDIDYPIEINGYIIGYYNPTELPYTCNLCEDDATKTVTFSMTGSGLPYNFGGTNTFDSNFYEFGDDNGIIQDICVANIVLSFETGPCNPVLDCDIEVSATSNTICDGAPLPPDTGDYDDCCQSHGDHDHISGLLLRYVGPTSPANIDFYTTGYGTTTYNGTHSFNDVFLIEADDRFGTNSEMTVAGSYFDLHTSCSEPTNVGFGISNNGDFVPNPNENATNILFIIEGLATVDDGWCGAQDATTSCNGTATVNVTIGSAPFAYLWSDGSTAEYRDDLCEGNYDVTVTDSNGCSTMIDFSIGYNTPTIDIEVTAQSNTIC